MCLGTLVRVMSCIGAVDHDWHKAWEQAEDECSPADRVTSAGSIANL